MRAGAAVAVLTALALALRLPGLDDSLFGDELFTFAAATDGGLGDAIEGAQRESSPPLHFMLAWLFAKLGDETVTIRLPSLVAGLAAVPATYVLGRRTVGRQAAVVGAAIVALSATAIFYSHEARAYALSALLVIVVLAALLEACDGGGWRWWALVWAASAGAIYSHYTAALPLAAAFAWVVWAHRDRLRALLVTSAAVGFVYLPWLPSVGTDPLLGGDYLSGDVILRSFARLLPGHPYVTLPDLPGTPLTALLGLCALTGIAFVAARARREAVRPSPELVLLLGIVLVTPAGLLLYSLFGTDIYGSRYLIVILAPLALVLGAVLTAPPRPIAAVLTAGALLAVGAGGLSTAFDADDRRPPYRQAAEYVEASLRPGDGLAEVPLFLNRDPSQRVFTAHLDRPRRVFKALPVRQPDGSYAPVLEPGAWEPIRRGRDLYVVGPQTVAGFVPPIPPRGLRVRNLGQRRWRGVIPVVVLRYGPR
jgi:4-amino-4-deoxy-L-arabinose transferase-like glycosyltransferase